MAVVARRQTLAARSIPRQRLQFGTPLVQHPLRSSKGAFMGVMSPTLSVSGDVNSFIAKLKAKMNDTGADRGLTKIDFLNNVENPKEVTINIEWENVERARESFLKVKELLSDREFGSSPITDLQIKSRI